MKSKLVSAALLLSAYFSSAQEQAFKSNAHIGFTYPLSTNGLKAGLYSNRFSVHAISGLSFQEEAFCASGVASIIASNAHGLIASGIVNVIGKNVSGLAAAGVFNYTGNNVQGVQAAGVLNMAKSIKGAQVAGFANLGAQGGQGVQIAGFGNISDSVHTQISGFTNITHLSNVQIGGFLNIADSSEVQISGFLNVAEKCDAQVAGFVNVADEVKGTQVAGFINIAHKVSGVQLSGFINVADSSDCPIGIINIIGNGEQAMGVVINEIGTSLATFRSGGSKLYGIIGVGGNFTDNYQAFAMQAGLGMHIPVSRNFRFNTEVTVTSLSDRRFNTDLRSSIKLLPAVRLGRFEMFAGPTFSYTTTSDNQGLGKVGYSLWSKERLYQSQDLSIGFESGIQYHLNSKKIFNNIFSQKNVENE